MSKVLKFSLIIIFVMLTFEVNADHSDTIMKYDSPLEQDNTNSYIYEMMFENSVFPVVYEISPHVFTDPINAQGDILGIRYLETIKTLFGFSMSRISEFPPEGKDSFFNWFGSRGTLENKDFRIYLTFTSDPILDNWDLGEFLEQDLDSATAMLFGDKDLQGQYDSGLIIMIIYLDRIFYDEYGMERLDPLARLLTASAHELYGNVQGYLEYDLENPPEITRDFRIQFGINSRESTVKFLERFIASEGFATLDEDMKGRFRDALKREEENLMVLRLLLSQ